jgi:hypothetical protein
VAAGAQGPKRERRLHSIYRSFMKLKKRLAILLANAVDFEEVLNAG